MVTIEELRQISDMSPLERSFQMKLEEAKHIALTTTKRSIELNVMKLSFFSDQLANVVQEKIDPEQLYNSQHDLVAKFKEAGFTLTEEEPSRLIIASVNEDPMKAREREFEAQYLEKKVIASW